MYICATHIYICVFVFLFVFVFIFLCIFVFVCIFSFVFVFVYQGNVAASCVLCIFVALIQMATPYFGRGGASTGLII